MSVASARPPSPQSRSPSHPFLNPELQHPTLNSLSVSGQGEASSSASQSQPPTKNKSNPLNEFAQQVLGHEEDAENLLGFGRAPHSLEEQSFGDLLQSEERREQREHGSQERHDGNGLHHDDESHMHDHEHSHNHGHEGDIGDFDPEVRQAPLDLPLQGEGEGEGDGARNAENAQGINQNHGIYGGRIAKRKRLIGEEAAMIDVDGHPLLPHEYARLKRDSHKEVERRRRENINDGINELAQLIPGGMEKQGKGSLLKRAAAYLIELGEKAARNEDELQKKEAEKQDLEAQLTHIQIQLQAEHARSLRFETSWREAEDRAASSNFELERLKGENEDLKASAALSEAAAAGAAVGQ